MFPFNNYTIIVHYYATIRSLFKSQIISNTSLTNKSITLLKVYKMNKFARVRVIRAKSNWIIKKYLCMKISYENIIFISAIYKTDNACLSAIMYLYFKDRVNHVFLDMLTSSWMKLISCIIYLLCGNSL